jgi:hypothetical protein
MPRLATDHLVVWFKRCQPRGLQSRGGAARALGAEGVSHLREVLRAGPDPEAVETVDLLSRLEPFAVEQLLPDRIRLFERPSQDRPLRAQVIVRNARTQAIAFEVVDIDLEDRSKLRRLLLELKGSTLEASAGAPAKPAAAAG